MTGLPFFTCGPKQKTSNPPARLIPSPPPLRGTYTGPSARTHGALPRTPVVPPLPPSTCGVAPAGGKPGAQVLSGGRHRADPPLGVVGPPGAHPPSRVPAAHRLLPRLASLDIPVSLNAFNGYPRRVRSNP
jgi:hypothetical protein